MSTTQDTTGPQMGTRDADADPQRIIEAINRPRAADDDAIQKNLLPYLDLPGFGSEYDDCGEPVTHFCDGCGFCQDYGRTCYRSVCPRCGEQWDRRQATSISAKLDAIRRYHYSSVPENVFFHHLTISLPNDGFDWELEAENPLEKTIEVLKEILDELDCRGVMFYHPLRGEDNDDRGFWKDILFEQLEWNEVQDQLKFSPHFHAIVTSPRVPGGEITKRVEQETGWVIERITKQDSNVSISNNHDLARAVTYCLSHTGLYEDSNGDMRAAYRFFGKVGSKPVTEIVADDETEDKMDQIVREVAPRTLGIPWERMACTITHETTETLSDIRISMKREFMSRFDHVDSGSSDSSGSDDGDDGLEASTEKKTEERDCGGRIRHIGEADEYIADDEWRESVPYAEKTRKEYRRWRLEQERAG